MALVFYKSPGQSITRTVDLVSLLPSGATLTGASIVRLSPTTTPPLTVVPSNATGTSVDLAIAGGAESISYGARLSVSLVSGGSLEFTVAVAVQTNLGQQLAESNPLAFQALVGEVKAGDAAIGSANFVLPPTVDASAALVFWELVSPEGALVSMGNCYETNLMLSQFAVTVSGQAVIHVPSSAAPSNNGEKYTLRWTMQVPNEPALYSYEGIVVTGLVTTPIGVNDMVEIQGDLARADLTTEVLYEKVSLEVFAPTGNARLSAQTFVGSPLRVSSGWLYQMDIDTAVLPPSIAPYVVSWKYSNSVGGANRETARLFVLNASMLNAVEDCRAMVSRARTTLFQFADTIFDTQTIIGFLRRGMDMFNAAGGLFTSFDMTDATGAIRDHWLGYAEVAMLQAQSLAEGEKAFDFQGQAIQLNVDRTQYYDKLAADIAQRLEANVRPLKQNMQMKGVNGGSGNLELSGTGNRGYVGITVTPISGFGRYWNQARIR